MELAAPCLATIHVTFSCLERGLGFIGQVAWRIKHTTRTPEKQRQRYRNCGLNGLTVDGVAEDDGLVDLKLREQRVEAVHFLALRNEGVELRDTLSASRGSFRASAWTTPGLNVVDLQ